MDDNAFESRLSRIQTQWTLLRQAHEGDEGERQLAQAEMFERYQGATLRYLIAVARNVDAAEELFQDFAVRFLRGDFSGADPAKGKFRSYLKTSLIRLVNDYRRRTQRREAKEQLLSDDRRLEAEVGAADLDDVFDTSWRDELLRRTWQRLRESDGPRQAEEDQLLSSVSDGERSVVENLSASPQPLYWIVMQIRSRHPDLDSQGLADAVNREARPAKPYTAVSVRKLLQRARAQFAELLLDEVADSIGSNSLDLLEDELIASGLFSYCRPALEARRGQLES